MKVIEGAYVPIKTWCDNPEKGAIDQAINLSKLPFIFKQVCLMPDTHQGYGMPIGGVIALDKVIIPNAVGVDIGCGMVALKTTAKEITTEQIKDIFSELRKRIPLGFNRNDKQQSWSGFDEAPSIPIIMQEINSARKQLGTLGGGNHFIEIQKGDDGYIWLMIHSGSRNIGFKIANEYNRIAQSLCRKWHASIPKFNGSDGLAFFPIDTQEGQDYMKAMNFALSFALENRRRMMMAFFEEVRKVLDCKPDTHINIHHNYANWENHFGKNVIVHRKGATSAKKDQLGIIPGSQGTSSYIVKGKGNRESFESCSHGAGRTMSRSKAKKELNLEQEIKKLDDLGVVHSIRQIKDLDEASSAYKDINIVIKEQEDLVDVVVKLQPLGVIKA